MPTDSERIANALIAIQKYDDRAGNQPADIVHRYLLIRAETELGAVLGLTCTGEPSGWNADGTIASWSHDDDTCPIHEWHYTLPDDERQ